MVALFIRLIAFTSDHIDVIKDYVVVYMSTINMGKIALYIRLSVDDLIKKDESESITNQRAFLHDYLSRQDDLKQLEREEYVDDGYSGTTDHRPSFQRLLEDIKNRKVKTVIVKDLKEIQKLEDLKVAYFEKYKQGTLTKQAFLEKKSQLTKQIESLENRRVEEDKKEEGVPTDKLTRELVERYIDFIQCEASEIKNVIWKDERV